MRLEYAEYVLEKNQGEITKDLIGYLKDDKKIIEASEEEGKYKIDVEKLLNKKSELGMGTDKKDVYMLEEVTDETEEGKLGEIASTKPIKLAETKASGKTYKVVYYGKTESEYRELEIISDTNKNSSKLEIGDEVNFSIRYRIPRYDEETEQMQFIIKHKEEYVVSYGTTWKEFAEKNKQYYYEEFGFIMLSEDGKNLFTYEDSGSAYVTEIEDVDEYIEPGEYYLDCIECVYPNTNILVSKDGETTQAKDIKDGSDIAYYNFETNKVEIGKVEKVYIHKQATDFVRYEFEDETYLEATDYHPIYTKQGWKSYTRRNGYEIPQIGDEVKTKNGWKKLIKIESFEGLEDCYDFAIKGINGEKVNNYFANGTLVQGSY